MIRSLDVVLSRLVELTQETYSTPWPSYSKTLHMETGDIDVEVGSQYEFDQRWFEP